MIIEFVLRNRDTHIMRKLRETYAEFDMRNILEVMRKVEQNEAIIQIFLNADSYL